MDLNTEKVVIIFSAKATTLEDREEAQRVVRSFSMRRTNVRVEPFLFEIPEAATPGHSLGTELMAHLEESIGAIAFVDDLRANIAYEIGIFHGKDRAVLIASRKPIDGFWTSMSDLAGVPLADLNTISIEDAVHRYLTRLYSDHLRRVEPLPFHSLPSRESNLLTSIAPPEATIPGVDEPFGPVLRIAQYIPELDIPVGLNLAPHAKARLVMRGSDESADYSVYFRVRYMDRLGAKRRVWLGVTSLRRNAWIAVDERQFPGQTLTRQWRMLAVDFTDLLRRGSLLGAAPPDYLESVRFRAGARDRRDIAPIEVAFLGLAGVDD